MHPRENSNKNLITCTQTFVHTDTFTNPHTYIKSTILECNKEVGNEEKVFVDVILDEDMPNVCPLRITTTA